MEGKAAAIGDVDFVMPFSALGVDTFAVSDQDEAITDKARDVLEKEYSLIIVAENIAPAVDKVFNTVQNKALPCVLVVPFTSESTGFAIKSLSNTLKMATGINILKSD